MKLVIKFQDQSPSFSHGVELGRLMHKMERGDSIVKQDGFPVRIENKQTLIDCCNYHGYTPIFGETYYNEWIEFYAIKNTNIN